MTLFGQHFIIKELDYRQKTKIVLAKCPVHNYLQSRYIMATNNKHKDHIDVTKDQRRNSDIHEAIVDQLFDISPTVKQLVLKVKKESEFDRIKFLPGQWLDMFIPGIKTIGGYSMTSTPRQLTESGIVNLAIRYSDILPAHWIHTKCKKGCEVQIRFGGDFFIPENITGEILLVAGGVGINPICSMILYLAEIGYKHNVQLLYSAKSVSELLFKEQFKELTDKNPNFKVNYFVTQPHQENNHHYQYEGRRITTQDLEKFMNMDKTTYICGPPSLIELAIQSKDKCQDVVFETWWQPST